MQETHLPPLTGRGTLVSPQAIDDYLHQIALVEPYLLRGLPMYLLLLARRLKTSGAPPPRVQRIIVEGSLSPAGLKQEIAEAFGCEVREIYGSSELGGIAAECGQGWLHVATDLFMVEVLRPDGTAAEPGGTGIVVITSMANRAMPLIRYRIGDVGHLVRGECPCGRNTPRICIDGRRQESLETESGIITARQICQAVYAFPGVAYFKLLERDPRRIDLLVVASDTVPLDSVRLCGIVRQLVGQKRAVHFQPVRNIRPEESGKFTFVRALPLDHDPLETCR
jgi:phenylacetate-CoA ligase